MQLLLLFSLLLSTLTSALPLTSADPAWNSTMPVPYAIGNVTLDNGIEVFYREAGSPTNPTLLLLHGFPASSNQFRNLIPLLAPHYHVLAPDYPGFGFTIVPDSLNFTYTFDNLAATVASFIDAKGVTKFTPYLFDYGAPVGFRLALQRPDAIEAIVDQNGNAALQGFGQEFWAPVFALWNATTPAEIASARETLKVVTSFDFTKSQYTIGSPNPNIIQPESYWLDYALLQRPDQQTIQINLFDDYQNNAKMYPQWQEYLRKYQPKMLLVWGENDIAFIPTGAEALKAIVPSAELHFLDAGHFLLETNLVDMANYMLDFLGRNLGAS